MCWRYLVPLGVKCDRTEPVEMGGSQVVRTMWALSLLPGVPGIGGIVTSFYPPKASPGAAYPWLSRALQSALTWLVETTWNPVTPGRSNLVDLVSSHLTVLLSALTWHTENIGNPVE